MDASNVHIFQTHKFVYWGWDRDTVCIFFDEDEFCIFTSYLILHKRL